MVKIANLTWSLILFTSLLSICGCSSQKASKKNLKPNVVIIFLDDSGYSDFSPFKDSDNITPHVGKLAEEGTVYHNFHVPQAICSASRAALLTGCYPGRTKMFGATAPTERGLDPKYATLAEQLKKGGYATGWFGKWHLGDVPETRPDTRGFDETAGLMYSNDMWRHHPTDPDKWGKWPLQYWKNGKVIIEDVDSTQQKMLTKWSTDYSLNFVENHKDEPFFLYLAYSMPHVPIFCSDAFEGKSGKGLYGDVIMELDHGFGLLMDKLKEHKLDENTIVVFSSDNGPWSVFGNHAGKTPFREAKATSFDGGLRTQLIIKYPGVIPANNQSNKFIYSIDFLPTICELTGSPLPKSTIDGENVLPRLTDAPNNEYKRDYHPFSNNKQFEGVFSKDGRWKLILPHGYGHVKEYGSDGVRGTFESRKIGLTLYDMENDPYETTDVKEKHPDIFKELKGYADLHKSKFYSE
jgi:arylsulfatase A-like enzyme